MFLCKLEENKKKINKTYTALAMDRKQEKKLYAVTNRYRQDTAIVNDLYDDTIERIVQIWV